MKKDSGGNPYPIILIYRGIVENFDISLGNSNMSIVYDVNLLFN
jgi:hypothetical protein